MSLIITRDMGLIQYEKSLEDMRSFTNERHNKTLDELWLVQHPPVFTIGTSGKLEDLLEARGVPVVQSDRGGQITYHAPGQCIVYFMIDVRRIGLSIRSLVDLIESSIINLLSRYDIFGSGNPQSPGIYVEGKKIASIGLRIRNGCSYHGAALNVDLDLSPFNDINPCGYAGLQVTSMAELNSSLNLLQVGGEMLDIFSSAFKLS